MTKVSLATLDLTLGADDLFKAGSNESPLERILSSQGQVGLNSVKTVLGLRSFLQGSADIKNSFRDRDKAGDLGQNIFKTGKAAFDANDNAQKTKEQGGKLGMGTINTQE